MKLFRTLLLPLVAMATFAALPAQQGPQQSIHVTGGGSTAGAVGPNSFAIGASQNPQGICNGAGASWYPAIGFYINFRVLCIEKHDNRMVFVAECVSGNGGLSGLGDPVTGDMAGWWFVIGLEDNGEGANAAPDRVGPGFFADPVEAASFAAQPCDILSAEVFGGLSVRQVILLSFTDPAFLIQAAPLDRGNVQVR